MAQALHREIVIHEHVDERVLETGDPSEVHFAANLNPASSDDKDVMENMEESERSLAERQENCVEQLVKFAEIEPNPPTQQSRVPFVVSSSTIESERSEMDQSIYRFIRNSDGQDERDHKKKDVVDEEWGA